MQSYNVEGIPRMKLSCETEAGSRKLGAGSSIIDNLASGFQLLVSGSGFWLRLPTSRYQLQFPATNCWLSNIIVFIRSENPAPVYKRVLAYLLGAFLPLRIIENIVVESTVT